MYGFPFTDTSAPYGVVLATEVDAVDVVLAGADVVAGALAVTLGPLLDEYVLPPMRVVVTLEVRAELHRRWSHAPATSVVPYPSAVTKAVLRQAGVLAQFLAPTEGLLGCPKVVTLVQANACSRVQRRGDHKSRPIRNGVRGGACGDRPRCVRPQ